MTWRSLRHSNPPTGTINPAASSGHKCGNCNWQGKGRDDCPNNVRASQTVPYIEEEPNYPESPHGAL